MKLRPVHRHTKTGRPGHFQVGPRHLRTRRCWGSVVVPAGRVRPPAVMRLACAPDGRQSPAALWAKHCHRLGVASWCGHLLGMGFRRDGISATPIGVAVRTCQQRVGAPLAPDVQVQTPQAVDHSLWCRRDCSLRSDVVSHGTEPLPRQLRQRGWAHFSPAGGVLPDGIEAGCTGPLAVSTSRSWGRLKAT